MKSSITTNFIISTMQCVIALSAMALIAGGCASSPANNASDNATPVEAKPLTFKEEAQAVIKDLRNYSVHSFADDVRAKVPPALEFIAKHPINSTNFIQICEVKSYAIKTAARANDYQIAEGLAKDLLATNGYYVGWANDAAEYLANGMIKSNDFAGAEALYNKIMPIVKVNMPALVRLHELRASLYTKRNDMKGALAILADARSPEGANADWLKIYQGQLDDKVVDVYKTFSRYQEAYDYCISKNQRAKALALFSSGLIDDMPRAMKLASEILMDSNEPIDNRRTAWVWLFNRDHAITDRYFNEILGSTSKETNSVLMSLKSKLTTYNIHNVYDSSHPAYYLDADETIRTWEAYAKILRQSGMKPEFAPAQYGMVAYANKGDMAKAIAAARFGLDNDKLKPEERYELDLAAATLKLTGTPEAIAKSIGSAEDAIGRTIAPKERIKRIDRIGSVAVISKNESLARGFALFRDTVKPDLEKKRYVAKFSKRLVAGAGDWANLPFKPEVQPLDRKYGGGDLSFMTTDVATGDRGNAAKGGKSKHPTTLQVVTDEWGIHILLTYSDSRAREFEAGTLDAGGYECYIAPGDNQPYSCFLVYPKKDAKATIYHTSYDSPNHRRINDKDLSKMKSETLFTDDAIINYVAFSWDNFATMIPSAKSEWDLEFIFWGPTAAAWNGTESIHGRSTWGTLAFSISDADRAAIYRQQLFKAAKSYKAEKLPNAPIPGCVQGGIFENWQDPELGDPEFYDEVLQPLVDKLDKDIERVKAGMSDSDTIELSENTLREWRDIRFTVGKLRAAYLKRKLSGE